MELTKNWPHGARLTLRALLVLLLLSIVAMIVLQVKARRELARSKALHMELVRSIEKRLPVLDPDEHNASDVLNAAGYLLRLAAKEGTREAIPFDGVRLDREPVDEDLLRRAKELLARPHHRLVLDLIDLDAAVARARFQDSHDVSQLAVGAERYAELRISVLQLVGLLKTRAWVAIRSGDVARAYRDVETMLRIADWLRMEQPGIMPWLLRNAVVDRGTAALEELRQVAPATAEQREGLRRVLARLMEHGKAWGLEGERAFTYSLLWGDGFPVGAMRPFARHSNDLYERLIGLGRLPPYDRPPLDSIFNDLSFGTAGPRMLMTNLFDSLIKTDAAALRIEVARLSLAWDDYYDQRGACPGEPEALVPDFVDSLRRDPWSGENLRWRVDEAGCRLVSVGLDGRDDASASRPGEQDDDVTWRLPCHEAELGS